MRIRFTILKVTKDYNLGKLHANLTKEWHLTKNGDRTPYDVTPSSGKKVWWVCSRGHEWNATIGDRTRGRGCPKCYNEKRSETYRKTKLTRAS